MSSCFISGFGNLSSEQQLFTVEMLSKLSTTESARQLRSFLSICVKNVDLRVKCGLPPILESKESMEVTSTSTL